LVPAGLLAAAGESEIMVILTGCVVGPMAGRRTLRHPVGAGNGVLKARGGMSRQIVDN
jgi:hypothetical protein